MTRPDAFRIGRKLLILALLVAGVGYAGSDSGANKAEATALICCSACETDPPPLPCRRGCSPSC